MSTERATPPSKKRAQGKERGPHGRRLCRHCRVEVEPPRRTFCGQACVDEFLIRSDPSYARRRVLERDRGVCALCGVACRHYAYYLPVGQQPRALNLDGPDWEMDHVLPVVEGGGECGLDNLRTLCVPCHRLATRELRGRMAATRRATAVIVNR